MRELGAEDHRFHNFFQMDWYGSVIFDKKKNRITPMQLVDWKYMEDCHDLTFDVVVEMCVRRGLKSPLLNSILPHFGGMKKMVNKFFIGHLRAIGLMLATRSLPITLVSCG